MHEGCPGCAKALVFVGSNDRQVYAMMQNNGTIVWKRELGSRAQVRPSSYFSLHTPHSTPIPHTPPTPRTPPTPHSHTHATHATLARSGSNRTPRPRRHSATILTARRPLTIGSRVR